MAPDHQEVKNVQHDFTNVAEENARFHFFGGMHVGTDIQVEDLKGRYDALVFAHGAEVQCT